MTAYLKCSSKFSDLLHCKRIERSSDEMYNFDEYSEKVLLLPGYFKKAGFKYRTDLSISFFDGETPKTGVIAPLLNK
jgi:hypothetical protein